MATTSNQSPLPLAQQIEKLVVAAIPPQPQVQESLQDQLLALVAVANRLGLYDAADHLKKIY